MNRLVRSTLMTALLIIVFSVPSISAKNIAPRISFLNPETNLRNVQAVADSVAVIYPEIIDQTQEGHNKGFWFDATYIRWQEFIPTLDNFSQADIYLVKVGSPGDLIIELRDKTGVTTIDQQIIPEASAPSLGWILVDFYQNPAIALSPGEMYRIYVYSSAVSPSPDNRYFWRGASESEYCQKCDNDASTAWPNFDYAFRSYGYGVRRITNADFNLDKSTDISVYRPSNGNWYIRGESPVMWGLPGDIPVPGYYQGWTIAVYRPSNGKWYMKGNSPVSWGFPDDIPVQADYDGDGYTEIAVLRPSNGKWYIQGMGNFSWYQSGDIPVPCDYDGDFVDEIAVYRPSNGKWYVMGQSAVSWGFSGDIPVPGDYDGNGICDIAVYRPSNGNWYVKGIGSTSWGFTGDIPVPGDYDGCGDTEIAVLRPSNGKWYIQGMGNFSWYQAGDYPLPVRDTNADGDPYQ